MADVITSGAAIITPTLILGFESKREAATLVHSIIGRAAPDVTLRPAALRNGVSELGFNASTSEADSAAAEAILAGGTVCALISSDRSTVEMSFVVQGEITRTLEDATRSAWVVSFGWQEVTP